LKIQENQNLDFDPNPNPNPDPDLCTAQTWLIYQSPGPSRNPGVGLRRAPAQRQSSLPRMRA